VLLRGLGFSLQSTSKQTEGANHPDRDAQFHYLNARAEEHLGAAQPVISVDTKKWTPRKGAGRILGKQKERRAIPRASTRTGLRVPAELDPGDYPKGTRITDKELAALPVIKHEFHGDWNYTVRSPSHRTTTE
jgi:hypothetical protein